MPESDGEANEGGAGQQQAVSLVRCLWRGVRGCVLPGCCDAEDVAEQAIGEMLAGKCRLAVGWTPRCLVPRLSPFPFGQTRLPAALSPARLPSRQKTAPNWLLTFQPPPAKLALMMSAAKTPFSFTRAALSTSAGEKSNFYQLVEPNTGDSHVE